MKARILRWLRRRRKAHADAAERIHTSDMAKMRDRATRRDELDEVIKVVGSMPEGKAR